MGTQSRACCLMQAMLDRRDQRIRLVEQSHRIKVENQIIRTGSPDADRVHPRIPQTEEIVEHDRMQGLTQLQHPRRWAVGCPLAQLLPAMRKDAAFTVSALAAVE